MTEAEEKAAIIAYLKKHGHWSVRDEPILKSKRRTVMWLGRLERTASFVRVQWITEKKDGVASMYCVWRLA